MSTVSSLGIGSGILNQDLVDQLAQAQRAPTENRLDRREAETEARLSAFGQLQSAITEMRLPARQLANSDSIQRFEGNSSNAAVGVSVESDEAGRGSFSVNVDQVAQSQALATGTFDDRDSTAVGTGTLTFQVGDQEETITLDEDNNTLNGLRDAINSGDFGVSASILDTGNGFRMVLNSDDTGVANEINITADGDQDLARFNFPGQEGEETFLTETTAAQDAIVTINGIEITRSSNEIDGVIDGVTFEVNETTTAPANVTVEQDVNTPTERVQALVDAFNEVQDLVNEFTEFDPDEGGSLLTGDSTVRNMMNQVRQELSQIVPGLEGANVRSLADVGISTDFETGRLEFDSNQFQEQLRDNPDDVSALFSQQGRASDGQVEFVRSTSNTQAGEFDINIDSLATRGSVTGDPLAPEITLNEPSTLSISLNDGNEAELTLEAGTFTREELLESIRSQISENPVIQASGDRLNASLTDNNELQLRSARFGSESSVEITSIDQPLSDALGLNQGDSGTGTDVVGTIDGQEAQGDGQVLFLGRDQGDASGIQVRINGGETGDRGSIQFIDGIGNSLVDRINSFEGENGLLSARTDSLRGDLDRIQEDRIQLNERIEAFTRRLSSQFAAADSIVSQFQSTGDFLSQQLASLNPGNNN